MRARHAHRDVRGIIRGILPAALTRGGLGGGPEALVDDVPMLVQLDVVVGRLPAAVKTTAYVVVAEALANVAKHARAGHAEVAAELVAGGVLVVEVRDDGRGGADARRGTGLTGLVDRVEACGGTIRMHSPPDASTTVHVELPVQVSRS